MSSVRIRNNGPEEVGVDHTGAAGFGNSETFFALLAVVEELGHEQLLNFVWDSGLNIVSMVA